MTDRIPRRHPERSEGSLPQCIRVNSNICIFISNI